MSRGPAKPRLLVLASTYPRWRDDPEPGFVHELARRLVDDFEVRVLCPHARGARRREVLDGVEVLRFRYAPVAWQTLVNGGVIVANIRRHRWKGLLVPPFLAALLWQAWWQLRRFGPAVVHAHWLVPQGVAAALVTRRAPFVVTSHGADLFALRSAALLSIKRFVTRRASALTVVSPAMREEAVRQRLDGAPVTVEPMGVDLQVFSPDARVPREPGVLLFVGRIVEKKGLPTLIEAMPAILERHADARLLVAGFGPGLESARAQAASLGVADAVQFLGAVKPSDLVDLYRRAQVFVAPFTRAQGGDQEGLGLVSIEAAGCGCRLVLGDVPAVRSALGSLPGVRLVEPGNAAALAQACSAALTARASDGLREAMIQRFDWSVRAVAYRRLLLDVARAGIE